MISPATSEAVGKLYYQNLWSFHLRGTYETLFVVLLYIYPLSYEMILPKYYAHQAFRIYPLRFLFHLIHA